MLHTNEKIIKNKVGLLNLAEELQNISKACKVMGLSRETFYYRSWAIRKGFSALYWHDSEGVISLGRERIFPPADTREARFY